MTHEYPGLRLLAGAAALTSVACVVSHYRSCQTIYGGR